MEPMSPALEGRLLTGSPGKSLESLFNFWLSYATLVVAQFSHICRLNLGPALKTVPTLPNPLTIPWLWRKEETQTLHPFTPLDVSYLSLKARFCFSTGDKSIIYIWKSLSCVWLFVTPWTIQSMEFSRPEYQNVQPIPFLGDLPNPGIEPRSPSLQSDSLPAEPPRKPKNTGVGSLSLLQGIFLTQGSNWGLLHHRQILYKLSY